MRAEFRGYYRPTDAEFTHIWSEGEIVVDANVLLNLYRYSIETRNGLLDVLGDLADRLWLPHQAALEYQRSRIDVMTGERQAYERILKVVADAKSKVHSIFEQHSRHLILQPDEGLSVVEKAFGDIESYVRTKESMHPDLPHGVAPGDNDKVRDRLTELFEGRVGSEFTDDEYAVVCADGERRYDAEVPPGYRDAGKPGERQWGDLLLWKQVIAHARSTARPIIFVTDERKDDWWLQSHGQLVLPRPELVEEMWREAGVMFYMYRSSTFMEIAQTQIGSKVTAKALKEVQDVAERRTDNDSQLLRRLSQLEQVRDGTIHRLAAADMRIRESESMLGRLRDERTSRRQSLGDNEAETLSLQRTLARLADEFDSTSDPDHAERIRSDISAVRERLMWVSPRAAKAFERDLESQREVRELERRLAELRFEYGLVLEEMNRVDAEIAGLRSIAHDGV